MSKKFSFLNDLDKDSIKIKYQVYEAVIGFEHISVTVPLDRTEEFESKIAKNQPKSGTSLIRLAESLGGGKE